MAAPVMIDLTGAGALYMGEAEAVVRSCACRLVVLAGPAGSGKTTLAASLYSAFQKGPFAGYRFAGSRTLVGFEERCWLARASSGGRTPDTERTPRGEEMQFLHLQLAPIDAPSPRNEIMLADLSGEHYSQAVHSLAACQSLPALRRADNLAILIDGALVADLRRWQWAVEEAQTLLRSCVEAGILHPSTRIDLVFSKWDVVTSSVRLRDTEGFVDE